MLHFIKLQAGTKKQYTHSSPLSPALPFPAAPLAPGGTSPIRWHEPFHGLRWDFWLEKSFWDPWPRGSSYGKHASPHGDTLGICATGRWDLWRRRRMSHVEASNTQRGEQRCRLIPVSSNRLLPSLSWPRGHVKAKRGPREPGEDGGSSRGFAGVWQLLPRGACPAAPLQLWDCGDGEALMSPRGTSNSFCSLCYFGKLSQGKQGPPLDSLRSLVRRRMEFTLLRYSHELAPKFTGEEVTFSVSCFARHLARGVLPVWPERLGAVIRINHPYRRRRWNCSGNRNGRLLCTLRAWHHHEERDGRSEDELQPWAGLFCPGPASWLGWGTAKMLCVTGELVCCPSESEWRRGSISNERKGEGVLVFWFSLSHFL